MVVDIPKYNVPVNLGSFGLGKGGRGFKKGAGRKGAARSEKKQNEQGSCPDSRDFAGLCLSKTPPKGVLLSRATGVVSPVGPLSPRSLSFVYNGWVPADRVVWRGLLPSTDYSVVGEGRPARRILRTDGAGRLVLTGLGSGSLYRVTAK